MTTSTKNLSDISDFFYRALAGVAIIASILLVFAASTLPEGLERGDLIVYGHGVVLAALVTALVLRAVHTLGFNKALQKLQTRSRITHVTA